MSTIRKLFQTSGYRYWVTADNLSECLAETNDIARGFRERSKKFRENGGKIDQIIIKTYSKKQGWFGKLYISECTYGEFRDVSST